MNQPDLTPAGICANIEHYRAVWIQQKNSLQHTENELAFWITLLKEHNGLAHTGPDS